MFSENASVFPNLENLQKLFLSCFSFMKNFVRKFGYCFETLKKIYTFFYHFQTRLFPKYVRRYTPIFGQITKDLETRPGGVKIVQAFRSSVNFQLLAFSR